MEKQKYLIEKLETDEKKFDRTCECNTKNKIISCFFIILLIGIIGRIIYVFSRKEQNEQNEQNEQYKTIFSLSFGNGGKISPIYDDIFDIDSLNNIFNKIAADKLRIIFEKFDSLDEVELAKKIKKCYLTDEIMYKILDNNNTKSSKKYVLISYIYKISSQVILEKKVQIKEEYQNQLKKVENLEENTKLNEYKKILKQIGFYVPTEVFYGGRIDITFEAENNDIEKLNNLNKTKDKIFNLNLKDIINSLKQDFRNVKCDVIGGRNELFKKDGDLIKWIESLQNNKNIKPKIILYDSLETIDNFFDSELSNSFFKFFYYNKKKTKLYKDGEYNGYVKNEIRDGEGKMEYTDGRTYTGFWEKDKRKGDGSLFIDGKLVYKGKWKDDKRQGNGTSYKDNKKVYEGEWKNDKEDGEGKLFKDGEMIYNGEWKEGERNGIGEAYENGEKIYEGEWKNGKRNGKGKEKENEEIKYNGNWENDKYHGEGIIYNGKDNWIKGYFIEGKCKKEIESNYSHWYVRIWFRC